MDDKWVKVFRTVADQADSMMTSLQRILKQCHDFAWELRSQQKTPLVDGVRASSSTVQSSDGLPSDQETLQTFLTSFITLYKSLHTKRRYYIPSIERVLKIIAKGIEDHHTTNGEVLARFTDMKSRCPSHSIFLQS